MLLRLVLRYKGLVVNLKGGRKFILERPGGEPPIIHRLLLLSGGFL